MKNTLLIFRRELRDQLRDRRTLFTIAVLPMLMYPLMGMAFTQIAQFRRDRPANVWVLGAEYLPESPALLDEGTTDTGHFSPSITSAGNAEMQVTVHRGAAPSPLESSRTSARNAIRSGRYDAVIIIPPGFSELLSHAAAGEASPDSAVLDPEVYADGADHKSQVALLQIEQLLRRWRAAVIRNNLERHQIPLAAADPFQVNQIDVAKAPAKRAAMWAKVLPFILFIWALTGAFYPAIDLCAGEKERGTLETLLVSPAARGQIVWGKLLTVMTFSIMTSLLNLASLAFTGAMILPRLSQSLALPSIASLSWLVVALVPVAALFSALSLAVSSFARSSKEGQYYLLPLLFLSLPLMTLPMMPTTQLDLGTSLIPLTGIILLLRAVMEGHGWQALIYLPPVLTVTGIGTWLAIRWAVFQFNSESVLFRESERWSLRTWLYRMFHQRQATPTVGQAMACGVLLLVIRFYASTVMPQPGTWVELARIQALSMLAFIAIPAVMMAVVLTRQPRRSLLLRRPAASFLAAAVLLAVAIHPLGVALAEGIARLYPVGPEVLSQLQYVQQLFGTAPSFLHVVCVLALIPAVCEELAFRGFILSGLRRLNHPWAAIAISSLFFGVTHGILQQSLSASILGMVIGYLAVRTGSLFPCIAFHLVYNALSFSLALCWPRWLDQSPTWEWLFRRTAEGAVAYQPLAMAAGALLAWLVVMWLKRQPMESADEPVNLPAEPVIESMDTCPNRRAIPSRL